MVIGAMGVAGCGKTTVGRALAERLEMPFQEGDAHHPPANVVTMAGGTPLTADGRTRWLVTVAAWMDERRREGTGGVLLSQLATPGEPTGAERPVVVSAALRVDRTVDTVVNLVKIAFEDS